MAPPAAVEAVSGAAAGCVALVATYPLMTVSTQQATRSKRLEAQLPSHKAGKPTALGTFDDIAEVRIFLPLRIWSLHGLGGSAIHLPATHADYSGVRMARTLPRLEGFPSRDSSITGASSSSIFLMAIHGLFTLPARPHLCHSATYALPPDASAEQQD